MSYATLLKSSAQLLLSLSYHATSTRISRPFHPKWGRQLVLTLRGLRTGGDNDLFGFVGLRLDDVHQLLPLVVCPGGRFVGIRQPQDFHQDLAGRLVGEIDAKRLVLGDAVGLQIGAANDNR